MASTTKPPSSGRTLAIAADVGGTFTDLIVVDRRGGLWRHKLLSTPPDFERAVLLAIGHLMATIGAQGDAVAQVAHGTTVATNAILEHRGARTALLTTRGFRDVLELRRIRAPQMYDVFWDKPKALVERYLRFEVDERMSADGQVVTPLDEAGFEPLAQRLKQEKVESIAVCFLHAYAYPRHEERVGAFLRKRLPKVEVSLSSEVLRVRKEYERTATTVVNAYVRPVMQRYLDALRRGLDAQRVTAPLLIMQSAGGLTPAEDAAVRPVFALESGPAAGVLAASHVARRCGIPNAITLDIGGTTAKASLIEGGRTLSTPEYEVGASLSTSNRLVGGGGERIIAPTIDIAEVGAGGGSIAYLDKAGGLHVGPRSAGARPGPACYRLGGTEPTLTDADVVLGYIRPGKLANGDIVIDMDAAARAVHDRVGVPLGIDVVRAAEGIHRIANARTMRALRAVSTERGRDPREFALIAFGGNGPVHAAALARELRVRHTLIPPLPGLFSALGLLFGGVTHHDARSCQLSGAALTPGGINAMTSEMSRAMLAQFARENFAAIDVEFNCELDVRFLGQASEIQVPVAGLEMTDRSLHQVQERFKSEHERLYGHRSDPDNPVQVVAVRLVGTAGSGDTVPSGAAYASTAGGDFGTRTTRRAFFGAETGAVETPVLTRAQLKEPVDGPLLIDEYDSTTVVFPGMKARLDEQGDIVIDT